MHQTQIAIRVDVASQDQAAVFLADAEDGTDQAGLVVVPSQHLERKQQTRGRQTAGIFSQVGLVDIQCRFAVEFEQHIAVAARDLAGRAIGLPAAVTAMADTQCNAIKTDCHHAVGCDTGRPQGQGLDEGAVIAGEPAADRYVTADTLDEAIDQRAAIDVDPATEQQDSAQAIALQLPTELDTGVERSTQLGHMGLDDPARHVVEMDAGHHAAATVHTGSVDFTCRRTAGNACGRKGLGECGRQGPVTQQTEAGKHQQQLWIVVQRRAQRRRVRVRVARHELSGEHVASVRICAARSRFGDVQP